MPCDSVILNRVELPAMNRKLTDLALVALGGQALHYAGQSFTIKGFAGYFRIAGATLIGVSGQDAETIGKAADLLKRAYSAEVVKYTAKRNGWQIKQTAAFAYEVIK
jgi:hypothetical protein